MDRGAGRASVHRVSELDTTATNTAGDHKLIQQYLQACLTTYNVLSAELVMEHTNTPR